jgi:pimeloyl-ACP methyl ester carboxylesterase
MVMARPDVDAKRTGIWGVSLGAYVAVSAAIANPTVKSLVLDTPFDSPARFIELQTTEILGIDNFMFNKLARFGFFLVNLPKTAPSAETLAQRLSALKGRDKLFITSEETPRLETQTLNVFNNTPEPKELVRLKHSKTSILYDVERKNYESTIVEFFKKHLPVRIGS